MRYLLNSAVITAPGDYEYRLVTVDEAKAWLAPGQLVSTIGYPETAAAMQALFGGQVNINRIMVTMQAGDEALVFRLVLPPGAPRIDPTNKGRLTPEYVAQNSEIGVLKRVR